MCGRFILKGSWADVYEYYDLLRTEDQARNVPARYNISPTQEVLFVTDDDGERVLKEGRWWLVPHWAKEVPKYTLFNARSEDAHKKPSFRDAYKSKRCLIPADAYIEWTTNEEDEGKDPNIIHLPDWEHFAFAGLWAHNSTLGVTSCTILTAAAVDPIHHLHHRMPVILERSEYDAWLMKDTAVDDARELLKKNRGRDLVHYQAGRAINSSRREGSELIEPVIHG